ncbi:DNA repair exonuclease [bacterium]|nr:DNA repair exonuclease [bacterium]
MFKFLHTADIHLDSPLRGLESYEDAPVEQIRQATRRAFDNLVDLAIEEAVAFVLIAGDLYDGDWKDYHTGLFFINGMSRLRKEGIRVFLVSGNHDAASQITKSLQLPDNVIQFPTHKASTEIIEALHVAVHGRGYESRVVSENLVLDYPRSLTSFFNIGLLHTSLNGRAGHEPYAPCTVDDLTSRGYDYWALGHVHLFETVRQEPWIVFPGNIQGRHIRETGAKSATLVTVEEGRIVDVRQREVDVLRWSVCDVDVSGCETVDHVIQLVRVALDDIQQQAGARTLAVRLNIVGAGPIHSRLQEESNPLTEIFRGITTGLGDMWLEKVRFRTRRAAPVESTLGEESPIAGLMQAVATLELNTESILRLSPEIASLKSKLPAEFLKNDDSYLSEDPQLLAELNSDVRELLIAKLLKHGSGT